MRRKRIRGAEDFDDFVLLQERLEAVISDLEAVPAGALAVDHIDRTARELASIQRHYTLAGFANVARVLSRVEHSLRQLGAPSGEQPEVPAPRRFDPPPTPVRHDTAAIPRLEVEAIGRRPRRRWALLATVAVAAGCVAVALVWLMRGQAQPAPPPTPMTRPAPTRAAVVPPPPPVSAPGAPEDRGLSPGEMLAGITIETESVEAALRDDDVERALGHLIKAAAIDRHNREVKAAAGAIIDVLVAKSEAAAEDGRWNDARDGLKHARNLATNFFLETSAIDRLGAHYDTLARFVDVGPGATDALEAGVGQRVRVTLTNSEVLFASLEAVDDGALKVRAFSGVGGGELRMERTIPLDAVAVVRIYGDGEIDFSSARESPLRP